MSGLSFAFLGSGEFDPWSEPVERWLLARSRNPSGPVLVCPTAAAHEGDESYDGWANKGLDHYHALGIAAVPSILGAYVEDHLTDGRAERHTGRLSPTIGNRRQRLRERRMPRGL